METNEFSPNLQHSTPHVVVLFHGLRSTPLELAYLVNYLQKSGVVVETPSFDGYSYGTGISSWRSWLEQAKEIVCTIQASHPGKVSVGGLSLGATLALAVSAELEGLCSVIALSTTLRYDGWAVPWYRFLLPLGEAIGFGRFYEYREREPYGVKNEHLRELVKKALESNHVSEVGGESFTLRHLVEGDKLCRYTIRHLPSITADLLAIHAIDDEVASVRNAEMVIGNVSSVIKEAIFLGNSYHIITVDNERETVCAEVADFLTAALQRKHGDTKVKADPVISSELARFLRGKKREKNIVTSRL
jgi:carboxylesterase